LHKPQVLAEITTKIGRGELREIFLAELKRASKISRLAVNISSVIILHTILGRGTPKQTLHSFFKSDKTPVGMINDTLGMLLRCQWYLHQQSDGYIYSNQANIVKIIEDEASLISIQEVENEVRKRIESKLTIQPLKLHFFEFQKTLSNLKPNLLLLHWKNSQSLEDILNKNKLGHLRLHSNNLLILHGFDAMNAHGISRFLAACKLILKEEPNNKIAQLLPVLDEQVEVELVTGFNTISYLQNGKVRTISFLNLISGDIVKLLEEQGVITGTISPEYITSKILPMLANPTIKNLHDRFLRDSSLKMLKSKKILLEAIIHAYNDKLIQLRDVKRLTIKKPVEIDDSFEIVIAHSSKEIVQPLVHTIKEYSYTLPQSFPVLDGSKLSSISLVGKPTKEEELNRLVQIFRMLKLVITQCHGTIAAELIREGKIIVNSSITVESSEDVYDFLDNLLKLGQTLKKCRLYQIHCDLTIDGELIISQASFDVLGKFAALSIPCEIRVLKAKT
jgi:hypothetical protein